MLNDQEVLHGADPATFANDAPMPRQQFASLRGILAKAIAAKSELAQAAGRRQNDEQICKKDQD